MDLSFYYYEDVPFLFDDILDWNVSEYSIDTRAKVAAEKHAAKQARLATELARLHAIERVISLKHLEI